MPDKAHKIKCECGHTISGDKAEAHRGNLLCPACFGKLRKKAETGNIRDRLAFRLYDTKVPYVDSRKDNDKYMAYIQDVYRLQMVFKKDALEHVGLSKHPKVEKIWIFAWEHGHSSGYDDVLNWLEELSDLMAE